MLLQGGCPQRVRVRLQGGIDDDLQLGETGVLQVLQQFRMDRATAVFVDDEPDRAGVLIGVGQGLAERQGWWVKVPLALAAFFLISATSCFGVVLKRTTPSLH